MTEIYPNARGVERLQTSAAPPATVTTMVVEREIDMQTPPNHSADATQALVIPSSGTVDWSFDVNLEKALMEFGGGLDETDEVKFHERRSGRPGWDALIEISKPCMEGFTKGKDPKATRDYEGIIWRFYDGPKRTCTFSEQKSTLRFQHEVEKTDANQHHTIDKGFSGGERASNTMAIVPFGQQQGVTPAYTTAPNPVAYAGGGGGGGGGEYGRYGALQQPMNTSTPAAVAKAAPNGFQRKEWVLVQRFTTYRVLQKVKFSVVMPDDSAAPLPGTFVRVNNLWGRWHFRKFTNELCTYGDGVPITYLKASSDVSKALSLSETEKTRIVHSLPISRQLFHTTAATSNEKQLPIIAFNRPGPFGPSLCDRVTGDMLRNEGIIPKYSTFKITSRDGKNVWAKLRIVCGFMQRNAFDATDKGTLFVNLITVRNDLVKEAFHLVQTETFAALGHVFTAHVPMAMRCIGPGAEQASIEKLVRRDVETRKARGLIDAELKCHSAHYAAVNIWVDLVTAIRLKIGYPLTFAQVQEALTDKTAFDLLRVDITTNIAALDMQRSTGTDVKVLSELAGPHADYEWTAYDLFLVSEHCKDFGSDAAAQLYIKESMDVGKKSRYAIYCLHKRTREFVKVFAHAPAVEAVAAVPMAIESKKKNKKKKEKEKEKEAATDARFSVKQTAAASNVTNKSRADRHTRADSQRMSSRRKQKNAGRKTVFEDQEE